MTGFTPEGASIQVNFTASPSEAPHAGPLAASLTPQTEVHSQTAPFSGEHSPDPETAARLAAIPEADSQELAALRDRLAAETGDKKSQPVTPVERRNPFMIGEVDEEDRIPAAKPQTESRQEEGDEEERADSEDVQAEEPRETADSDEEQADSRAAQSLGENESGSAEASSAAEKAEPAGEEPSTDGTRPENTGTEEIKAVEAAKKRARIKAALSEKTGVKPEEIDDGFADAVGAIDDAEQFIAEQKQDQIVGLWRKFLERQAQSKMIEDLGLGAKAEDIANGVTKALELFDNQVAEGLKALREKNKKLDKNQVKHLMLQSLLHNPQTISGITQHLIQSILNADPIMKLMQEIAATGSPEQRRR